MREVQCDICFKTFGRKGDLTRHSKLHFGIKPYECEDCGKRFSQFSGLKTHKNVHTGAKPYKCGINTCNAAFGDPSSCTRHRKEAHSRSLSYKCPQPGCFSNIKRRSAFVAHLKKHRIDPKYLDLRSMNMDTRKGETVLRSSRGALKSPSYLFPAATVGIPNFDMQFTPDLIWDSMPRSLGYAGPMDHTPTSLEQLNSTFFSRNSEDYDEDTLSWLSGYETLHTIPSTTAPASPQTSCSSLSPSPRMSFPRMPTFF